MNEETESRILGSALEGVRWSTVFGGLCVSFGVIGTVYSLIGLFATDGLPLMARAARADGAGEISAAGMVAVRAGLGLDAALGLVQVVVGFAFLRRQGRAAMAARGFAFADIFVNGLHACGGYLVIVSETDRGVLDVLAMLSVGWPFVLWCVWPVLMLVWLSRAAVRAETAEWGRSA